MVPKWRNPSVCKVAASGRAGRFVARNGEDSAACGETVNDLVGRLTEKVTCALSANSTRPESSHLPGDTPGPLVPAVIPSAGARVVSPWHRHFWQEAYNAWALARLGLQIGQKVEYRKYLSREAMGRFTGNANTNGFAEPAQWRFHTIWPRDNHEIVHVYTDTVGRPSDFFNEGIAVAMQTDPVSGNLASVFNGVNVHDACRSYLVANTLPRPLANYVTTTPFRNLPDSVFSYRVAGSFVRHLIERHGMPVVLDFFRQAAGRDESLSAIRTRAERVFGRTLEELEADWHTFLRG